MELIFFLRREWKLLFLFSIILISVFFVMRQRFLLEVSAFFGAAFAQGAKTAPEAVFGLGASSQGQKRLAFRDDGSFQISVFEDLHFGEGEDNRESPLSLSQAWIIKMLTLII
jgi:hypothetical protein